jgi:predicted DsbA family dithiol-disulfide isomerase
MSTPIKIDVWSDVVCPWCFIGRRRLQKALEKLPEGTFEVHHRAFQLQPEINETVKTSTMLSEKYRVDANQVAAMQANVCSIADGEGLCYDLGETESGNTNDAHRLLLWAETIGKGDQLLEVMYSGYFEKKKSLFTRNALIEIASEVGITAEQVNSLLDSSDFSEQVTSDQNLARSYGASGVPFFVIDNKYGISGAQPQELFDQTLATALKESVDA